MNSPAKTFQGLRILVTRPRELADNLASLIEQHGGEAFLYPVIGIEDPDDVGQRDHIMQSLADFDIAIFISPTAVRKAFEQIDVLPPNIQVAAIGSSTESALAQNGARVSIVPQGHDSEALLQHPGLQSAELAGKSVVILRGQGGRELLHDTLVSRGASVSYAELYKRQRNDRLMPLSSDIINSIDIITITSNEGLQYLYASAEDRALLLDTPLLVPGERSQRLAEELGFNRIIRSENATDSACIQALLEWAGQP